MLRESCINVRIPKYGSRVLREGIASRYPHIGFRVLGPGSQVKGTRSWVPGKGAGSHLWVPGLGPR